MSSSILSYIILKFGCVSYLYKPSVKAMNTVITITMILESDCVVGKRH